MLENDPLWYKDAIIYEVHVRAFQDSDGDGIGDFRGLTERLDYLQELGVTAIWLLPFYPSPLRDDGYDIADYTDIHPNYGTMRDFEVFLEEAHRRGLRVITELVLNHTSDQHPWFQRARRAPAGSVERDFYVWSDRPDRYTEARIIFQDYELSNWSWDPVAKAYYWHRFFSHQPDLNFDSPAVREAIFPVIDFWLEKGVDGLRLDAVPYLFEREGTNCENLPETYDFLRQLRAHVDARFSNRMLLAEANQWPEDAARYFGSGDICHMAFHFPLMPRLFMAIHMEDRFPILDILDQTPTIPDNSQWTLFLRNHDELTLEMVTDEERDYMNRVYAGDPQARINLGIRRRLAPLLRGNRRRIELMNALLLSLPGTPVIYYGDEIGMGDNIYLGDRNGVRTPMQWSPDRNAGFSRANPQQLYLPVIIDPEGHFQSVNVEAQQDNPYTLLSWMRWLIAQRKRFRAFGRGSIEFLHPSNARVLAFLRRYGDECLLIVVNLSRFVQHVELDLPEFRDSVPVEVFGRNPFPVVGEQPMTLTLGPHGFYWFSLEPARDLAGSATRAERPVISLKERPEDVFRLGARRRLEAALRTDLLGLLHVPREGGIRYVDVLDVIPLEVDGPPAGLVLLAVDPYEGDSFTGLLPLSVSTGPQAETILRESPDRVVARLSGATEGVLHDATGDPAVSRALLDVVASGGRLSGELGDLTAAAAADLAPLHDLLDAGAEVRLLTCDCNHSTVAFDEHLVMELDRRVDAGVCPDLEVGQFLTERGFHNVPPILGSLHYRRGRRPSMTLGIVRGFVPNQGSGWTFTRGALATYLDRAGGTHAIRVPFAPSRLLTIDETPLPDRACEALGDYRNFVHAVGRRTAELHQVLASELEQPDFVPVPFTSLYQRSLYQSMRGRLGRVFRRLNRRLGELPGSIRDEARALHARGPELLARYHALLDQKIETVRTRVHGDYHLGQLLVCGDDVMIRHFAGDPSRPLGERRLKRSPLYDVVSMLASFEFAACFALDASEADAAALAVTEARVLEWSTCVGYEFFHAYRATVGDASFLPSDPSDLHTLLDTFLLDRWIVHLDTLLVDDPGRAWIAIKGLRRSLDFLE